MLYRFRDRRQAGQRLAKKLALLEDEKGVIVLGIPRGGVVFAAEIARVLSAPFDILVAHKISAPFDTELALGAMTENEIVLDEDLVRQLGLTQAETEEEIERQRPEIARRLASFRKDHAASDVKGETVVADDGAATGSTMRVTLRVLREQAPAQSILAIPVGAPETVTRLVKECDQSIVLETPVPFWGSANSTCASIKFKTAK